MPNSDFQRHSFLGGEVSPSLYERADMEKFGKWFSKAENIRFNETGAFRNRCGFTKVADTKFNSEGQIIKLLSFSFNDDESFLVELGPGYARFFRNGSPVIVGGVVYEIPSPMTYFTEKDIKYAQSGDTVFITHPNFGIFELARLQSDGTEWEFNRFNADILPMKEQNDDKNKMLTLAAYTGKAKYISTYNPDSPSYLNVSFTFDGSVIYTAASATRDEIVAGIRAVLESNYSVTLNGWDIYIENLNPSLDVPSFSISYTTSFFRQTSAYAINTTLISSTATISVSGWAYLDAVIIHDETRETGSLNNRVISHDSSRNVTSYDLASSMNAAVGLGGFDTPVGANLGGSIYRYRSSGVSCDLSNFTVSFTAGTFAGNTDTPASTGKNITVAITAYGRVPATNSYSYQSALASTNKPGMYTLTANTDSVFPKVGIGDCVLVKHSIASQSLDGNYGVGVYTLGPVKSDGNWRAYNLGNWAGGVNIQYSTDNGVTWVNYYQWTSQATDQPYNNSTSGSLVADDLVLFRVILTVTAGTIRFFFTANSFETNSYYKTLFKNSDTQLIVECIKNDIGTFASNSQFRLPAFSDLEGWPQTIAFYQNRLFFGKDYIVYGSRSNDFWDFYEPIKLQADDPMTMSLLSQKVNTIRNLVTQRSFFTFTAGGEFGIGSEGALTQNDKYLKPFSANGSVDCNPILISDKLLFVDKSYNSIRALQYSLEADGYEAPDITLTLRALLQGERIISTDVIYEEKEALFLSDTGTVWVLKYITDQNVLSWSHWKHAFGKITNICVVPNGAKHDLYIGVEANGRKWIEKMDQEEFMDTTEYFDATEDAKISVTGAVPGDKKVILQEGKRYIVTVDENGQIDAPDDTEHGFKVGSVYVSTATLLAPVIQISDYAHANYEAKVPFKVFFYYLNSFGFKVGVSEGEKMPIEWQPVNADIDDEIDLTSGKKSVLINGRFDGSAKVSFVQDEPFPMEVVDVLVQTDFGGK